jgi:PII-like signaling protein
MHREPSFHLSPDLPIMISVVDTPAKITEAAEAVQAMLEPIVISDIEMTRLVRSRRNWTPQRARR